LLLLLPLLLLLSFAPAVILSEAKDPDALKLAHTLRPFQPNFNAFKLRPIKALQTGPSALRKTSPQNAF
jgi:hypothetical protein